MYHVLIACEESQSECLAFRVAGAEAYSCDLQDCSGGHPEWHIKGDVVPLLRYSWDLIIAHPPCTYLAKSGACNLFDSNGGIKNPDRLLKLYQAADFFRIFLNVDSPRVCIENPVPLQIANLPPPSQYIHPYFFGDPWLKLTCFWLKGLYPLVSDNMVRPLGRWVSDRSNYPGYVLKGHRSAKLRSKSFPGVSRAMASQWGPDLDFFQTSLFSAPYGAENKRCSPLYYPGLSLEG